MRNSASGPADPLVAFGERLRRARKELGLTQLAFARREGFNRTYISSVERGRRNPGLINVLRLAQALGLDAATLLDDLPPPPGPLASIG